MLGFPDRNGKAVSYGLRIVSFFKDEPIVGGFINSFYLIIIGFLSNKYYFKYKNSFLLITIILLLAIFLTGERANTIKAFVGIFLFISFFIRLHHGAPSKQYHIRLNALKHYQ